MINGKHGQGTHCTKMGADKSAENTTNAPKFIYPRNHMLQCLSVPRFQKWVKKSGQPVGVSFGKKLLVTELVL